MLIPNLARFANRNGGNNGLAGLVVAAIVVAGAEAAQRGAWRSGKAYECRRVVRWEPGRPAPRIVVAEFFTHGQLKADGSNLAVFDRTGPVPWRVLQTGPGDFCRIAFQTRKGQTRYEIYYGGQGDAGTKSPAWTANVGLLLETRQWRQCNLNSLASVQRAFAQSKPIGGGYVASVFHRFNPFAPKPGPFLSRYSGRLLVPKAGRYAFFTSSQDCSFLLIDGQQVVAAPGRHRPVGRARFKGQVKLSAGAHRFEYWHAASGPSTCMVAAWQPPDAKRIQTIPARAFGAEQIAPVIAPRLEHRTKGPLPDFVPLILGDVPLPDNPAALVRVLFKPVSVKGVTVAANVEWDFGDGQTSSKPEHVYLRPGLYTVAMRVRRGGRKLETANRIQITRALVLPPRRRPRQKQEEKKIDTLADYLPILDSYDPSKLDGPGLLQLVRAYDHAGQHAKAVAAGKVAFAAISSNYDDQVRWELVRLIGPLVHDQLGDPQQAAALNQAAARMIQRPQWRAACAVEAADIFLNDLLLRSQARQLLQTASRHLGSAKGTIASRLHRVWGDLYARDGDRAAARKSYLQAAALAAARRSTIERTAWRGAYSRSVEAFLREGKLDRARDELRRWQTDFPGDMMQGYLSLLLSRYLMQSNKLPQAIAKANDLLVVNPDSPYADQLLYLVAQCEEKRGDKQRALAAYQSLVTDYPGSPLVNEAKKQLQRLQGSGAAASRRAAKKPTGSPGTRPGSKGSPAKPSQ